MWDQKKTEQIAGLEKTTGLGEKKLYCGRSVVVFFSSHCNYDRRVYGFYSPAFPVKRT